PPTPSHEQSEERVSRARYPLAVAAAAVLTVALVPASAHAAPKPASKYDWLQFAYDPGKSANDTAESTVNLGNVKNLKQLFNVADGTEVKTGGWPVSTGGGKSSSALTIATTKNGHTYLYASNQGHGRVTTIDLANASKHIFNLSCSQHPDTLSGCTVSGANPWARGPAYDANLDLFFQMGGTNNGSTFVA